MDALYHLKTSPRKENTWKMFDGAHETQEEQGKNQRVCFLVEAAARDGVHRTKKWIYTCPHKKYISDIIERFLCSLVSYQNPLKSEQKHVWIHKKRKTNKTAQEKKKIKGSSVSFNFFS